MKKFDFDELMDDWIIPIFVIIAIIAFAVLYQGAVS